jgi:hypothetical protein
MKGNLVSQNFIIIILLDYIKSHSYNLNIISLFDLFSLIIINKLIFINILYA